MFSSPKFGLATAALAVVSPVVQACVTFHGTVSTQAFTGASGDIEAIDNGVVTCWGDIDNGNNDVECISGYSLNYDYTDNPSLGPMPITYCNPERCFGIDIPLSCTIDTACCPSGGIPCFCYACTFSFTTFCD